MKTTTPILRCITEQPIIIPPTDGTRTILTSTEIFTGSIRDDFTVCGLSGPCGPTPKTRVMVYEIIKTSTFEPIFESLSSIREHLCVSQSQIIAFLEETDRDHLHKKGYGTFFLIKPTRRFFVIEVRIDSRRKIEVGYYPFDVGHNWNKTCPRRVVVPKL